MFLRSSQRFILGLIMVLMLGLSGCARTTPIVETPSMEVTVSDTPSAVLTDSPPIIAAANLVTVGLETWDIARQAEIRNTLQEIALEAGLNIVERDVSAASSASADASVVILLTDTVNATELATAAPETRFVSVSRAPQNSAANLAVIQLPVTERAFLAGYLTTVIAPDFRSAGLFNSDEPYGPMQVYAFQNGAGYFCGTCYPYYAPLVQFPMLGYLPSGMDTSAWQAKADELLLNVVYIMYLDEMAADPVLMTDLANKGIIMTGAKSPPDTVRSMWAATIGYDLPSALQDLNDYLLGEASASSITAPLLISEVNESFVSPGKLENSKIVQEALEAGKIAPLTP